VLAHFANQPQASLRLTRPAAHRKQSAGREMTLGTHTRARGEHGQIPAENAELLADIDVDVDVDALATRLNDICRSATLDLAFRIGELIVKELFSNSTEVWERERRRHRSYRALAARGDLMLSASALCRAVKVYALVDQLGGRDRWVHLSASHFQEVLSLPPDSRDRLLHEAELKSWSVTRLRAEVARCRPLSTGEPSDEYTRNLRRVSTQLGKYRERVCAVGVEHIPEPSLQGVREALRVISSELRELEALIEGDEARCVVSQSHIRSLGGPADQTVASTEKG
jgi:hypothetical protein